MPSLNIIECRKKCFIKAFVYILFMFNKSSILNNIGVFEGLNVKQIGIAKEDSRWADLLTIWWGDLKTQIQILAIQTIGISINKYYDKY